MCIGSLSSESTYSNDLDEGRSVFSDIALYKDTTERVEERKRGRRGVKDRCELSNNGCEGSKASETPQTKTTYTIVRRFSK